MADEIIESIKDKINKLIERIKENKDEIEKLQIEITELSKIISEQEELINKLKLKCKQLIIAEAIISNHDLDDAKKLMSKMVRDINKCIALLNAQIHGIDEWKANNKCGISWQEIPVKSKY